jgi:predicted GNAT family acetyltransferase
MTQDIPVEHNPAASRFETRHGGALSVCDYRRSGSTLTLFHTEVPPSLQGHGIAAALVKATLEWAQAEGLRVRPTCSYVAGYIQRYPAFRGLVEG